MFRVPRLGPVYAGRAKRVEVCLPMNQLWLPPSGRASAHLQPEGTTTCNANSVFLASD